jgi:hypothetical protein
MLRAFAAVIARASDILNVGHGPFKFGGRFQTLADALGSDARGFGVESGN